MTPPRPKRVRHFVDGAGTGGSTKSRTLMLLSLLGIGFFLVFVQANAPSLDADGIHYAAVAKEIARSGRWLLPYDPMVDGPHYWHLPLTIWATAFSFKLFGVSPASAKLYSMLMTLAAVGGLFALGRRLSGPWTGWFAGMAFLLTNHVLRIARQCRVDLPLIAFVVWAFYGLVRATGGDRRWHLFAGLCSLGAVMTKEFVGLVPLVCAGAYFVLRRQWRELVHPLFLAAWALAVGPVIGYVLLEQALYGETLWSRYYAINFSHLLGSKHLQTPWTYYGWAVLDKYWYFLPLAAAGAWLAWKRIRAGIEPRWGLVFLWAAAFPVGFSLAAHKVHYYILPSYAAAALWVGLAAERWLPSLWRERVWKGAVGLTAAGALGLACFPVPVHRTRYAETLEILPRIEPVLSRAPGQLVVAGLDVASLLFYSDGITRAVTAHHPHQFRALLASAPSGRRYCLIRSRYWEDLEPGIRDRWERVVSGRGWLLLKQEAG